MSHRVAIVSDVHADLQALADALERIGAMGCDTLVCAGDLVDYGLFPEETLELLRRSGAQSVRGNHDRWVARDASNPWGLTRAALRQLASLPESWSRTIEGVRIAVHHGSPRGDMEGIDPHTIEPALARSFLRQAACDVLVVGHTHRGYRLDVAGAGTIVNPAALLCHPASPDCDVPTPGTFGVLELPSLEYRVVRASDGAEVAFDHVRMG